MLVLSRTLSISTRIIAPATAIMKLWRLKPVIDIPKIRLARNPPSNAPTTPVKSVANKPPFTSLGSMRWATYPAIKPKTIQVIIPVIDMFSIFIHRN